MVLGGKSAVHVGRWVRQLPVERKVHPSVWEV